MSVAHDPHHGPWTMEQVLALEEDRGQRRELMGEALLMPPAPGAKHQRASSRLWQLLDGAVQRAGAPVEVLEAVNVVLPDGLFIPDIVVVEASAAAQDPVVFDSEASFSSSRSSRPRRPAAAPTGCSSRRTTRRRASSTCGAWSSNRCPR